MGGRAGALFLALVLLLLAGCGGGGAGAPQVSHLADRPTPTPVPTPPLPELELRGVPARQGTAFLVVARHLVGTRLQVSFAGSLYPLLRQGGAFFAYVPVDVALPPGPYRLEVVQEDLVLAAATLEVADGGFPREVLPLPPETSRLLLDAQAIEQENQALATAHASFRPERLWQGPWVLPAQGPFSDPFGLMRSLAGGPFSPHSGLDIAAPEGAPVVAPARGVVVLAQPLHLRGLSVVIDHGAGVVSGYHHLSSLAVTAGQVVEQGEAIGAVGSTGLSTGPHLHWEVVVQGVRVDPLVWLQTPLEP